MLCANQDHNPQQARVLAAFTTGWSEPDRFCGTARLIMGTVVDQLGSKPPLDALHLMQAPHWPHESAGIAAPTVAEITRFVIPERSRSEPMRQAGMPERIVQALWRACMDLAAERGATYVYAIMPTYVVRLMARAGIALTAVEECRLNEEDETARRLFATFQVYWQRSHPRLYVWPVEATETAQA
jgi:hypothetical protein